MFIGSYGDPPPILPLSTYSINQTSMQLTLSGLLENDPLIPRASFFRFLFCISDAYSQLFYSNGYYVIYK